MLRELEGIYSIIHIGGEEYKTKYSMNCLLCLEIMYMPIEELLKIPYTDWDRQAVVMLAYSSLCDIPGNYKAVNERRFEDLKPSVFELERMIAERDIPIPNRKIPQPNIIITAAKVIHGLYSVILWAEVKKNTGGAIEKRSTIKSTGIWKQKELRNVP